MNKFVKNVALYVFIIVIAVAIFNTFVHPQEKFTEMAYSDFVAQIEKKNVSSVIMVENSIKGKLKDGTEFSTYIPNNDTQIVKKMTDYRKTAGTAILVDEPSVFASSYSNSCGRLVLDYESDPGGRRSCHEFRQIPCKNERGRTSSCELQ